MKPLTDYQEKLLDNLIYLKGREIDWVLDYIARLSPVWYAR